MLKNISFKNRYRIDSIHDSGGMADIYKGTDLKTGATVAIKVLKPEFSDDRSYVTRFIKEARAMSQLKHKNIVTMCDYGTEGKNHYIVFEFIEGMTLKQVIDRKGADMGFDTATRIMIDICSAIEHAHGRGLVHRDIKPQNIMIKKDGTVKLTDFGIAKNISGSTVAAEGTEVMGSAQYFSPEQAMGERVDARSDIYSMGIVFFELITGTVPFEGESSVAVAIKHINEAIREPRELREDVPRSINAIILKATRKEPKKRYASAAEMKEDLMRSLITPDGNFVKLAREQDRQKKKVPLALIAVGVSLFIVLSIGTTVTVTLWQNRQESVVTVPKFLGLTEVEAQAEAATNGFKLDVSTGSSDTVEKGIVISQTPDVGDSMDKDGTISIVVSDGPAMFEIQSFIGMDEAAAVEQIEAYGLTVVAETTPSDGPAGYVVTQDPSVGTTVVRGDEVTIYVSVQTLEGKKAAPTVKGLLFADAIQVLKTDGFTKALIYEEPESDKEAGTVTEQSPAAGIEVSRSDWVTMWVTCLPDRKYSAINSVTHTIGDDGALVQVVVEVEMEDMTVSFVASEVTAPGGVYKQVQTLYSAYPGLHDIVIYINHDEVERKSVEFK